MGLILEEIKHLITGLNYYQLLLLRDFLAQRMEKMENRGQEKDFYTGEGDGL